jgi:hypothetical protein
MPNDVQQRVPAPRLGRRGGRFERAPRRREGPFAKHEAALAEHEATLAHRPLASALREAEPARREAGGPDWVRIGAWTAGVVFSLAVWAAIVWAIVTLAA